MFMSSNFQTVLTERVLEDKNSKASEARLHIYFITREYFLLARRKEETTAQILSYEQFIAKTLVISSVV
jgi:hypothetical protein